VIAATISRDSPDDDRGAIDRSSRSRLGHDALAVMSSGLFHQADGLQDIGDARLLLLQERRELVAGR
jgi:hypothetical protein